MDGLSTIFCMFVNKLMTFFLFTRVSSVFTSEEYRYYALALVVIAFLSDFIANTVSKVAVREASDCDELEKSYWVTISIFTLGVVFLINFASNFMLPRILGLSSVDAALLAMICCLNAIFIFLQTINNLREKFIRFNVYQIFHPFVLIILFFILQKFGFYGASTNYFLAMLFSTTAGIAIYAPNLDFFVCRPRLKRIRINAFKPILFTCGATLVSILDGKLEVILLGVLSDGNTLRDVDIAFKFLTIYSSAALFYQHYLTPRLISGSLSISRLKTWTIFVVSSIVLTCLPINVFIKGFYEFENSANVYFLMGIPGIIFFCLSCYYSSILYHARKYSIFFKSGLWALAVKVVTYIVFWSLLEQYSVLLAFNLSMLTFLYISKRA